MLNSFIILLGITTNSMLESLDQTLKLQIQNSLISISSLFNLVSISSLSWNVNICFFFNFNVCISSDKVPISSINSSILSLLFSLNCYQLILNWSRDIEMSSVDMWLHSDSWSSCCSNNFINMIESAFHSFLRSNK